MDLSSFFCCSSCVDIVLTTEEDAEETRAIPRFHMLAHGGNPETAQLEKQEHKPRAVSPLWLYNKSNQERFLTGFNGRRTGPMLHHFIFKITS